MHLDSLINSLFSLFTNGIVSNLVSSFIVLVVGSIAGILFANLRDFIAKSRPIRRVLRLNPHGGTLYVVAATIRPQAPGAVQGDGSPQRATPSTGLGELKAASYINQALTVGYPRRANKIELVLSETFTGFKEDDKSGEIISLGGPKFNEMTRSYREGQQLALNFDLSDPGNASVVERRAGAVVRTYQQVRTGVHRKDFGIITRLPNRLDPRKENAVFLLEGAGTYGVEGCAKMLTLARIGGFSRYARELKEQWWQALVEVSVEGNLVTPTLVRVIAISSENRR